MRSADLFDRLAPGYDELLPFFSSFGREIVAVLDPAPASELLDVGAGRGAVSAAAVSSGCRVTAVDAAPHMVELLWREHPDVVARVMHAESLDFPTDSFDIAVGAFVIHLVDNPAAALSEVRRVLRPGGVVAVTMPGPYEDGGRWDRFNALVAEYEARVSTGEPFGRPLDVAVALRAAGFVDVHEEHVEMHLPVESPLRLWDFQMSHGFAGFVESLDHEDATELRRRALAELDRMRADGGIVLDRGATIHVARVP